MSISFADQVAIVTGAGGGLGRCHALELARRGAKVVINDLGGAMDGSGGSSDAAEAVEAAAATYDGGGERGGWAVCEAVGLVGDGKVRHFLVSVAP